MLERTATLSILILNKNRSKETVEIIDQLDAQTIKYNEIIIVDDNSSDVSEFEKITGDNISIHTYNRKNEFGLVKKYNFGMKLAHRGRSKYMFVMQNDMKLISPNLLEELVDYMEQNLSCGVVGPTIYDGEGRKTWGGITKSRIGHEINTSEAFMMRCDCFDKVGFFEGAFIYYYEDLDYFERLKLNGYYTHSLESVSLIHSGGGTTSRFINQKDYYRPRGCILFMKRHNKSFDFLTNLRYFKQELYEQQMRMVSYIKKFQLWKIAKLLFFVSCGTFAGLAKNLDRG